jgi:hypothetical protein
LRSVVDERAFNEDAGPGGYDDLWNAVVTRRTQFGMSGRLILRDRHIASSERVARKACPREIDG